MLYMNRYAGSYKALLKENGFPPFAWSTALGHTLMATCLGAISGVFVTAVLLFGIVFLQVDVLNLNEIRTPLLVLAAIFGTLSALLKTPDVLWKKQVNAWLDLKLAPELRSDNEWDLAHVGKAWERMELREIVSTHTQLRFERGALLSEIRWATNVPPPGWGNLLLGKEARQYLQGAYLNEMLLPLLKNAEAWQQEEHAFKVQLRAFGHRQQGQPVLAEAAGSGNP